MHKTIVKYFHATAKKQPIYSTGNTPNLRLPVKQTCYKTADFTCVAKQTFHFQPAENLFPSVAHKKQPLSFFCCTVKDV